MASKRMFQVRINSDSIASGARDKAGRFASFQKEMNAAHEDMAKDAAKQIQKVLLDEIKATGRDQVDRRSRGQGEHALVNAIVAPENRRVRKGNIGFQGFEVMDIGFLDGLVVGYYYRDLEVGTSKFVGRQYRGYFFNPLTEKSSAPSETRRPHDPLMPILGSGGGLNAPAQGGFTPSRVSLLNSQSRHDLGPDSHPALSPANVGHAGGGYGTVRGGTSYKNRNGKGAFITTGTSTGIIPTNSLFVPLRSRERTGGGGALITIRRPIRPYHYVERGMADWSASGSQLARTAQAALRAGLRMNGTEIIP